MSDWDEEFRVRLRDLFGGAPGIVFCDIETTGGSVESDLITQIGYVMMRRDGLAMTAGAVIDWRRVGTPEEIYRDKVGFIVRAFANRDICYQVPWPVIESIGKCPVEVLGAFAGVLEAALAGGWLVGGHNFYRFDRRFLESAMRSLGYVLTFDTNRIVDTGLVEKARLARMLPPSPEPGVVDKWWRTLSGGVRQSGWSLSGACDERYGLTRRAAAMGAPAGSAHDAVYDTWLSAALWSALLEDANGEGQDGREAAGETVAEAPGDVP